MNEHVKTVIVITIRLKSKKSTKSKVGSETVISFSKYMYVKHKDIV